MNINLQKNLPTILMVGGSIAITGGVITTIFATRKSEKLIKEHKEAIKIVNDLIEEQTKDLPEEEKKTYSDPKIKDKIVRANFRIAMRMMITWAPTVALVGGGIFAMFKGGLIFKKRLLQVTAAYVTLDTAFKTYRNRVVEDVGEDKDFEYLHGVKKEKIEITDENGKKQKIEALTINESEIDVSEYGAILARGITTEYDPNVDYMVNMVQQAQTVLNNKFLSQGYLFLNDVRDELGLKPTSEGQVVGWVQDKNDSVNITYKKIWIKDEDGNPIEQALIVDFDPYGVIWQAIDGIEENKYVELYEINQGKSIGVWNK